MSNSTGNDLSLFFSSATFISKNAGYLHSGARTICNWDGVIKDYNGNFVPTTDRVGTPVTILDIEGWKYTVGILLADYEQQFSREFILNYADIFNKRSEQYIDFYVPGYRLVRDGSSSSITIDGKKYRFDRELFNKCVSALKEDFGVSYEYCPLLILQEYIGLSRTNRRIVITLSTKKAGVIIDQIIKIAHREVSLGALSRELKIYQLKQMMPQIIKEAIKKITGDVIFEVIADNTAQVTQYDIIDR